MSVVAGVDYGVRRAAITHLGHPDGPNVWEVDLVSRHRGRVVPEAAVGDALSIMASAGDHLFSTFRPTLVAIEKPITGVSGNAATAAAMSMVAGVFVLAARRAGAFRRSARAGA